MDRDEFMELVYETFADEPDNVLANGIIEAADAYVEHEKAQLSQEGTTSDLIDRQAAIDALAEQMPTPYTPDGSHPADEQIFQVQEVYVDCITTIELLPTIQPVATDTNVGDKISKFIDGLEEIFADLRERHVDDSVCGLCEYDGAYMGQSGDWCNECPGFDRDDCFKLSDETRKKWTEEIINALPSIQPEPQHGRVFKGIVVAYPSYSAYPEYKGKPYFSIKYTENGQEFIGYSTYNPKVLSEYLKEYFIPSAQPETAKRIVGKSRDGMTLWYQCDMCNEPVDEQDNYCRGCGRRLIDG